RPGDAVRLTATLGPPAEPSLPGGFDFGRQAWYLGIGGVGYSMQAASIDMEAGPLPWRMWFTAGVEKVRVSIGRAVVAALPGETGGIANALITGERGGISAATDSAYRDSGLYHILSISGLHMVVMAGAIFFAVRMVCAAIPAIALHYPIKKWAAVAAALGALGYLLISGSSFATVRAYVQITILFAAMLVERPALALRNVALAALGLLVVWPESLFDAGFAMSFAAVVALIAGFEGIRAREVRLGRADVDRGPVMTFVLFVAGIMGSTLIATAAVAPIAAYQFHTSQQYGALANLVALPVCDLFVMPLLLATLLAMPFGLEAAPLWLAGWGIDAMTGIAQGVAKLPGAAIPVAAIPASSFLAMLAGGMWLLLWTTRWRLLGVPLVLVGLALSPTQERPDVIVGRDGKLVAARADGNRFSALPAPRSMYAFSRWLEADGDARSAKSVAVGTGFTCDAAGCTAMLKGQRLAVTRHASAVREDCKRASILVLDMPRPKGCSKPAVVIDPGMLRRGGVHAIVLTKGGARVETVAAQRGERPWSRPPPVVVAEGAQLRAPRLTQFALQAARAIGRSLPRPEEEDWDVEPSADGSHALLHNE
ncbi:MAG: ComEC/Rec2 family competence protein, partial [Hyphomicrobiaceae bacterium]